MLTVRQLDTNRVQLVYFYMKSIKSATHNEIISDIFFVFFLKSALPHLMDNLTWNYSVEPLIVPKEKVNNLGNTWRYLWGNRFSFGGCCTHLVCMFGAAPCRPVSLLANTSYKQCCTYSSTLMFDLVFSSRPFYIISRAGF